MAVPCHGAGEQEDSPKWGVVAPVSPLGKWAGGARDVLVPSAVMLQATSHFASAWRGHSRKELPEVGGFFMQAFGGIPNSILLVQRMQVSCVKFR